MGVLTFTEEHTSAASPARIFKATILDSHNLIPKLLPQVIQSIEYVQGTGAVGSIKQINFAEGSNLNTLKYHIDELNEETYTYNYTVIEGDALTDKIEKITHEVKLEAAPCGGTVSKVTSKYYTKGNFELKEDDVKAGKEKLLGVYKVIEAYLVQNPDAYA